MSDQQPGSTRRDFMKTSTAAAVGSGLAGWGVIPGAHAQGSDEIRIGLIGAGGRGSGAVADVFMGHETGVKLVAVGEMFPDRLEQSLKRLSTQYANRVSVKAEHQFTGFDAYQKVLAVPEVNYVILASPPGFRPAHLEAALGAGKHVFCEKPLALSFEELDKVVQALESAKGVLFVGFNRRWSPMVRATWAHFASGHGPLVLTYRVNAGSVPPSHWYHDRRQGGRLVGEVCHFVDTCGAIVGEDATDVRIVGSGPGERSLADDLALVMHYPGGSVAAITYAVGGHHSVEKERLEVLGRGRSAAIDDFRNLYLNGKNTPVKPGKGHADEFQALAEAVALGAHANATRHSLATMRVTLEALTQLTGA